MSRRTIDSLFPRSGPEQPGLTVKEFLRYACWFGMVSGFVQVIIMLGARHFMGTLVTLGPHMVWMTPLSMVLTVVPVAVLLAVLQAILPHRVVSDKVAIATFSVPAIVNLGLFAPGMHPAAVVLLSIGIATVFMRWLSRHVAWFHRAVRTTTAPLVLLMLLAAATVFGGTAWREHQAKRTLPPSTRRSPNVVLLVLDTVRGLSSSISGYSRPTMPNLERWASRSIVFTRAIAPGTWTLPSHSTMFTGHWPHELGIDWDIPLPSSARTLAEAMSERGYLAAGFVANPTYTSRLFGLGQGFQHYEDFPVTLGEILVSAKLSREIVNSPIVRRIWGYYDFLGRKRAEEVSRRSIGWIGRQGRARSFFVFVNLFDAHEPYLPPPEFDALFASPIRRRPDLLLQLLHEAERQEKGSMTPAQAAREREAYEASIAYQDHWVGFFLDSLDHSGLLDSTIVVVTSDHGEQFGEHRRFGHGNTVFRQLVEVPLMILLPHNEAGGTVVQSVASLRDLPATIADLVKLGPAFPGKSLVPCWQEHGCPDRPAYSELRLSNGKWARSVVTDSLHYIALPDSDLAYDWRSDPEEERNISRTIEPGFVQGLIKEIMGNDTTSMPLARRENR